MTLLAGITLSGGPTHDTEVVATSGGRLLGANSFYGRAVQLRWYRRDSAGEMTPIESVGSTGVYRPTVDDVGYGLAVECSAASADAAAAPGGMLRKFVQLPRLGLSPATHAAVTEAIATIRGPRASGEPFTIARVDVINARYASAADAANERDHGRPSRPYTLEISAESARLEPLMDHLDLSHAFAELDEAEAEDEEEASGIIELRLDDLDGAAAAAPLAVRAAGERALVLPSGAGAAHVEQRRSLLEPDVPCSSNGTGDWMRVVLADAATRDLAVLALRVLGGLDLDALLAPPSPPPATPPRAPSPAIGTAAAASAVAGACSTSTSAPTNVESDAEAARTVVGADDATGLHSQRLSNGTVVAVFPAGPLGLFLCSHLPVSAAPERATHVLTHAALVKRFDEKVS